MEQWLRQDEEARQIFRRKVDPRHRRRREDRRPQIEIKWGISAVPERGPEQQMETFFLRYVSRKGARKAGAEKSHSPFV